MNATTLVFCAGICQLGVLIASALVPIVLDWKHALANVPKLLRQLIWVYGGYVVLMIVAFGLLSVTKPHLLTNGTPLAQIVCGYLAVFWGIRLVLQFFYLDSRQYLTKWWLRAGHEMLTVVFAFLVTVYAGVVIADLGLF